MDFSKWESGDRTVTDGGDIAKYKNTKYIINLKNSRMQADTKYLVGHVQFLSIVC